MEMAIVSDKNESSLQSSFSLLEQLRNSVTDSQGHKLVESLQKQLQQMIETNQKFSAEIDFRKQDEKSFTTSQSNEN